MVRLVRPSTKYRTGFLRSISAIAREDRYYRRTLRNCRKDFREYVRRELGKVRGEFLPKGYVPDSRFWLVEGTRVLGLTSIRHRLTERLRAFGGHIGYVIAPMARRKGHGYRILKLGLGRARKLGLRRILITCSPRNIASRKIIEANGGVFWRMARSKQGVVRRYWIRLK